MSILTFFTLDTLNTLCSGRSISYGKCCGAAICVGDSVGIYQTFGFSFLDLFNTVSNSAFGRFASINTINVPSSIFYSDNGCMSVLTGNALNTLFTLCTISSIGHCKGCSVTISERNRISINKFFGLGLRNRGNTITSITLNTFCGLTAVYTINVPIAVLNGNDGSVSVFTLFTLDTLNTLLTLCACCTVGYGESRGITIGKRNSIGINKSFGLCFSNRGNTITSITLNAFCGFSTIYAIYIPLTILNGDYRSVSVFTFFTLDTLNTLLTLCAYRTIGYSKCCGVAICVSDCICINQTFGVGFFDLLNSVTSITLDAFGRFTSIYTINVPSSVFNGNYGSFAILAGNTLDTLFSLCAISTVRYGKSSCFAISESNCVSINKPFGLCFSNRGNTVASITLDAFC